MKNKKKGKRLVEIVDEEPKYVDLTNEELHPYISRIKEEYLRREGMDSYLNESDTYKYLSPFDWVGSINLRGIFAPVKWLAALLAGATALLIAGIIKAWKEGKKQIAIARVRQWIKGLVVIADGGYKKSRRTKDSLFLIEARARRDILQAAVMSGYAAGLDIPEKNNEPANPVESAKNESIYLKGLDGFLLENSTAFLTVFYGGNSYNSGDFRALANALKNDGFNESNYKEAPIKVGGVEGPEWGQRNIETFLGQYFTNGQDSQENSQQGEQQNNQRDNHQGNNHQNNPNPSAREERLKNILPSHISGIKYGNETFNNTPQDIIRLFNKISSNADDIQSAELYIIMNSGEEVLMNDQQKAYFKKKFDLAQQVQNTKEEQDVQNLMNASYNLSDFLPDDSQVDWSLMKTLKKSSWFGLVKHKTNLWKEAQSVYRMKLEDIKDENDRQKYITSLLTNVNAALSKITTPSIARNYANVINQFVTSVMKRSTNGTKQMMSRDNAANVGIKVGNHGNAYESSKYAKLFREENALFEATANNTPRPQQNAFSNNNWIDQYAEWKMNQQNREAELEYDDMKPLIDNTFKAMQNIFTANPSSDFLVFVKTRDQMNNFLNELTKSVYVIIESVAKKARENNSFGGNGKGIDNMINSLLSSDGDPKQNRSLRNLWDNIARPQLDSRAITRCQSIVTSPEFNYFLQILTVSIPLCIMSVFTKKSGDDSKVILMLKDNGTKFNNSEIISNNTPNTQQN